MELQSEIDHSTSRQNGRTIVSRKPLSSWHERPRTLPRNDFVLSSCDRQWSFRDLRWNWQSKVSLEFPVECSTDLSVPCICRTRSKIESTRSSSKMMETPSETYRSNLSLSRIPDQALLRVVSLVSSLSLWIVKIPSVPCCKLPWKLTPPDALAVCRENA